MRIPRQFQRLGGTTLNLSLLLAASAALAQDPVPAPPGPPPTAEGEPPPPPATSEAPPALQPGPSSGERPAGPGEPATVVPPAGQSMAAEFSATDPAPAATPEAESPPPEAASSAATARGGLDPKVKFGVGIRVEYLLAPKVRGANFGQSIGTSVRPYISGQVAPYLKFEGNLDSAAAAAVAPGELAVDPLSGAVVDAQGDGQISTTTVATVRVLDAVVKLEPHPLFNIWLGRFLPPTDRANLSGPYFQNAWNYPVQSNLYPAIYAGRHDGVAYWGQVGGGVFKWQLGMFDLTGGDNPLAAGRLVLNLLDPEPGYYNSSTYYGSQNVLAIGGTAQYQEGGDTAAGTGLDGAAFSVDLLFESDLGSTGTLSVEGAYYNFTQTEQGQSVWGLLGYLLPGKQGPGTLQPVVRLQYRLPDGDAEEWPTFDGAVHYVLDGHNARFALNYQYVRHHDGVFSDHSITLGGQLQF